MTLTPHQCYRLAVEYLRATMHAHPKILRHLDRLARRAAANKYDDDALTKALHAWGRRHQTADLPYIQLVAGQYCRDYARLLQLPGGNPLRDDANTHQHFAYFFPLEPELEEASPDTWLLDVPSGWSLGEPVEVAASGRLFFQCPQCHGRGRVPHPGTSAGSGLPPEAPEKCSRCEGKGRLKTPALAELAVPPQLTRHVKRGQRVTLQQETVHRIATGPVTPHPKDPELKIAPTGLDLKPGDTVTGKVLQVLASEAPDGKTTVSVALDKALPVEGGLLLRATIHCGRPLYGALPEPRTAPEYWDWLAKHCQLLTQVAGAAYDRAEVFKEELKRRNSNADFERLLGRLPMVIACRHGGLSLDEAIRKTNMMGYVMDITKGRQPLSRVQGKNIIHNVFAALGESQ